MTPTETASILRQFNEWRRVPSDGWREHPTSKEITNAINTAVEKEREELRTKISDLMINVAFLDNLKKSYEELIEELQDGRDELRAKIEAMERQEPYAFAVNFPESSRVELVHDLDEAYEDMTYEAYEVRKLYLAPGAKGE